MFIYLTGLSKDQISPSKTGKRGALQTLSQSADGGCVTLQGVR